MGLCAGASGEGAFGLARGDSHLRSGSQVGRVHEGLLSPGRWPLGTNGVHRVGVISQVAPNGRLADFLHSVAEPCSWKQRHPGWAPAGQCGLSSPSWPHWPRQALYESLPRACSSTQDLIPRPHTTALHVCLWFILHRETLKIYLLTRSWSSNYIMSWAEYSIPTCFSIDAKK